MDRLQKALDRAREERGQDSESSVQRTCASVDVREDHENIVYSETRTQTANPQKLAENRIIAGVSGHPQADVFRVLRTKVLQQLREQKLNSLAVTSANKNGGKSVVSANLAIAMALEENQTVLLVDLDLRRPSLAHTFGFSEERGLVDHLRAGVPIPDLLVHPEIERLVLLPAGQAVTNSSELMATPRMKDLVADILGRYRSRIVLFDLPPLLHTDDALQFLPQVQASLLVVEEGVDTPAEIQQCLRSLEQANLLGCVYNKARQQAAMAPY